MKLYRGQIVDVVMSAAKLLQLGAVVLVEELGALDDDGRQVGSERAVGEEAGGRDGGGCEADASHGDYEFGITIG